MVNRFFPDSEMNTPATNPGPLETPAEPARVEQPSFARDEKGQISVFIVLGIIPFILLVAFIFNSGFQTSRRIEMQGAADAAAVASAVNVARGMNFIVLNNNAMAEMLSLMIAVRCIRNVANVMRIYVPFKAAAVCLEAAECFGLCPNLDEECGDLTFHSTPTWFQEASSWSEIDDRINNESSGFGWRVLSILDDLNQISKTAFAVWAGVQANEYARKNGADLSPIQGFVLGGKSTQTTILPGFSVSLPIPTLPLARGPEQAIAFRLDECQYKFFGLLNGAVSLYLAALDSENIGESVGFYQLLRWANINYLRGDWGLLGDIMKFIMGGLPFGSFLGKITSALGGFLGIELLDWKSNPPKPMLLTDNPGSSTTDEREIDDQTRENLRPYLQYLGIALGRVPEGGRIGNKLFFNTPNAFSQIQFTYAQADVYNPTKWDMWTQDWRAQLTRSKLFDQKVNDLVTMFPFMEGGIDWTFVNAH